MAQFRSSSSVPPESPPLPPEGAGAGGGLQHEKDGVPVIVFNLKRSPLYGVPSEVFQGWRLA